MGCPNDHPASSVAEHFPALASVNRFRVHMHGPAGRWEGLTFWLEPAWTSVLVHATGRIDSGLEVEVEMVMEIAILDVRA